jgi:SPP1 gp7 family putative phage head morphogenesis protein
MESPKVLELLDKLGARKVGVSRTLQKQIRLQVMQGIGERESLQDIANRVRTVFNAGQARALTIAQTESGTAATSARFEGMKDAGVKRHSWLTAQDSEVRDSHAALDGETVEIGAMFSNGLKFPLDPDGPPGEVINCRCDAVAEE